MSTLAKLAAVSILFVSVGTAYAGTLPPAPSKSVSAGATAAVSNSRNTIGKAVGSQTTDEGGKKETVTFEYGTMQIYSSQP
jgi:hypothetical protein